MHIVFITHEYPLPGKPHGGIGTYIGVMAKELTALGVSVSVVGTGDDLKSQKFKDEQVDVYKTSQFNKIPVIGNFLNRWMVAIQILKIHKWNPVTIVEAPEMGLAFMPKWAGITYLIRMNGGHHFFAEAENRNTKWWRAFQEKQSFKNADHLCAVSVYVAERTRSLLKLGRVKIDIIPNPVDTKTFFEAQADFQEYILFVGSVCKKKGIEELIDAMKIVWREFPNCRLKVVGRDVIDERYGGSFIAYLKRKINGDHRITFEGAVDHKAIPDFINKAMMCVYPSYMEALPLAWLEALAMGKPFIGSRTGPGPEVVEDGVTGVLVNPRDPKEIAEAILKYLKHPKWSLKIGKNARKHIQKNFEANMLAQVNLDYFNRIKKR